MEFFRYKTERMAELLREEWGELRIPGLVKLIHKCKPRNMIEVGSYRGVSTEVFLLHTSHVTAIDTWPDVAIERDFFRRCGSYPHLTATRAMSLHAMPMLEDAEYDFCYLDGDHEYETVKAEIAEGKRLLKIGGWLAGHDYMGTSTPGVARAVHEAFGTGVERFDDASWAVEL